MRSQLSLWMTCITVAASGCEYDVWSLSDCKLDPDLCQAGRSGWQIVANCSTDSPLQVELGQGEQTPYEPMPASGMPVVHHASGDQGGSSTHVFLGVRVLNPDLAHKRFLLEFATCSGEPWRAGRSPGYYSGFSGPPMDGLPECTGLTFRRAIQSSAAMKDTGEGSVGRGGVAVFVIPPVHWAFVRATDECGRAGTAFRSFGP